MPFGRLSALAAAILVLAASVPAKADDGPGVPGTAADVRVALLYGGVGTERTAQPASSASRSIPLAFGLSAAVPGLGQGYNGQWIKAAALVAIEGLAAVAYLGALRGGREEEDRYRAYAHAHWNPVQYAEWLNDYADFLGVSAPPIETTSIPVDFSRPDRWTDAERAASRRLFDQIHAVEEVVYHPETGASFSHKLPFFGEQQYYELIGKYFQFAPGWEDYPAWRGADGYTPAIDPEKTGPDGSKVNVAGRFWTYDDLTEHANDLLRTASRLSAVLFVNHLAAAIDAAVFAKLHNDRLSTQMTVGYDAAGVLRPAAAVRLRL